MTNGADELFFEHYFCQTFSVKRFAAVPELKIINGPSTLQSTHNAF